MVFITFCKWSYLSVLLPVDLNYTICQLEFSPQSLIIQQFSYYKPLLQNQISTHIISLLASINPLQWICCCSLFFLFVMDEIRFVMIFNFFFFSKNLFTIYSILCCICLVFHPEIVSTVFPISHVTSKHIVEFGKRY